MKRLVPDPWIEATKKYKIGTIVEADVGRVTPFGVFIKLDDEINGLIHVSEISVDEVADPADVIKVGDRVKAKIIAIDPDDHRVALSIKALDPKSAKKEEKKEEVEEEEAPAEEEESAASEE